MSNVVDFNELKNRKQAEEKDIEIPQYLELKEEMSKMLDVGVKLVASDEIEARCIMKLIMERDENIKYCKTVKCLSRKASFIEVVPVYEESEIRFPHILLKQSYVNYLLENKLAEIDQNGMLFIND